MKISIRQLSIVIVIVALGVALWVSNRQLTDAHGEISTLREALGNKRAFVEQDHYLYSTTGYTVGDSSELTGSHLLRVDNHSQYSLEITFYDGKTGATNTQAIDLHDPLIAITYLPQPWGKEFSIRSTYTVNQKTRLDFKFKAEDGLFFNPWGGGREIADGSCFLYYFFYPNGSSPKLSAAETNMSLNPLTPERMIALAKEHEAQAVFFRVVARPGK